MATMKIEQRVELLARERVTSAALVSDADGTYLSLVIDAMQAQLGKTRRGKINSVQQAQVLAEVDKRFYAAVLRGVTTPDIAIEEGLEASEQRIRSLERNRRSAFARSTKSTVSAFIVGGGDIRVLDPKTVSKAALRKAIAPPEPTDRGARQISNTKGAFLRAVARRARGDPEAARIEVEGLIEELQKVLDNLEDTSEKHETTTIVGMRTPDRGPVRTRVGQPMLHRSA